VNQKKHRIFVTSPCSENWDEMKFLSNGKHCQQCSKTIVDFTNMSDTSILNYLKQYPSTCGRFFTDQLNRELEPIKQQKTVYRKMAAFAATIFSIIFFKNGYASNNRKSFSTIQSPQLKKYDKSEQVKKSDSATITGVVKNGHGKPLRGVNISFNGSLVAVSDTTGSFSFIPSAPFLKHYVLKFSYNDYDDISRTYHPSMGSTSYQVSFIEPIEQKRFTMGVIDLDIPGLEDIRYSFSGSEFPLRDSNKAALSYLAKLMRNNPGKMVEIIGSGKTEKEIKRVMQIQNMIINFLVDLEGISPERLKAKTETYAPKFDKAIWFRNAVDE
jgi:hypothetical protein